MKRYSLVLLLSVVFLFLFASILARSQPQAPAPTRPAAAAPAGAAAPAAPAAQGAPGGRRVPAQRPMGTEDGFAIFQTRCMACHGNPDANPPATSLADIRAMTPEKILSALTDGVMKTQGAMLTDEEKGRTAEFMGSRTLGSSIPGNGKNMPNQCTSNPPMRDPATAPEWSGWGADAGNTRFQTASSAGLTADQVPRLKLKWAFGFPTGYSANAQPSAASGRVFVGSDIGYVYSLDASTGCIYWSYETGKGTRNAMTIGPIKGQGATKYAVFFGDAQAYVYALDAQDGHLLWKTKTDDFFVARNTASPTLYNGVLYVPLSSSEEYRAGNLDYPCCTSRGSVVALDANTGKQIWKTYVVDEPKPTVKNAHGRQLYAPSGGSIWNSPSVDPQRHAVYVGTGDASSEPSPLTTDGVMALDMDTGKVLWTFQATVGDSFMGGCTPVKSEACPKVIGPDSDIGNSPMLRSLPGGKAVVVAGTKEGDIFALDPDNHGKVLWRANAADKPRSGIFFGGALDEQNAYYGFSGGGIAALDLATGHRKWFQPIAPEGVRVAYSAAATGIPGVVFQGGSDGTLTALSTADGKILWQVETAKDFATVNKVDAHGGSMRAPGATIAGGMVFVGSGYGVSGGDKPGNVLLAFSVQ